MSIEKAAAELSYQMGDGSEKGPRYVKLMQRLLDIAHEDMALVDRDALSVAIEALEYVLSEDTDYLSEEAIARNEAALARLTT